MDDPRFTEGVALRTAGKLDEAKARFRALVDDNSDPARGYYQLALIAVDQHDADEAIACYERAIAIRPEYGKALNNLGMLYMQREDHARALRCFTQAHALAPEDAPPRVNLGALYFKQRDFANALEHYRAVDLGALPADQRRQVLLEMGDCYLQLQRFSDGEQLFQGFVRDVDPHNVHALNQLAFIYLEMKQPATARTWAERALAENPKFKPAVQNRGLAEKDLGNYAEAEPYLRAVVELDPDGFTGYYNLACLFALSGDEPAMRSYLARALELGPFIKNHARNDPDFTRYRGEAWFQSLVR
jgi:tetratricopeptide (TPR) repeat protein